MSLISILKRLRIFRPFNVDEIAAAEQENALRDHLIAMTRVESSSESIRKVQSKLLESIHQSRSSSESVRRPPDAMAQFVHDMKSFGQKTQRN